MCGRMHLPALYMCYILLMCHSVFHHTTLNCWFVVVTLWSPPQWGWVSVIQQHFLRCRLVVCHTELSSLLPLFFVPNTEIMLASVPLQCVLTPWYAAGYINTSSASESQSLLWWRCRLWWAPPKAPHKRGPVKCPQQPLQFSIVPIVYACGLTLARELMLLHLCWPWSIGGGAFWNGYSLRTITCL